MNIPIQEWINANPVDDGMRWKGASVRQVTFVRDTLARLMGFGMSYREYKAANVCTVISEHRSKSIVLPVYSLNRPDVGLRLILRDNFYNWKISVISSRPVVGVSFDDMFYCRPPREPAYTGDCLADCYFEGFPKDLVFGYYETSDKKHWSAEVDSYEEIYMVVFLILRALGHTKPRIQYTRAEHKAEMDAEMESNKKYEEEERKAEDKSA